MNKQTDSHQTKKSLALFRVRLAIPQLMKLGGVLLFLISSITLLIIVLANQQRRDDRSMASESLVYQSVNVGITPQSALIVGQDAVFNVEMKPQSGFFSADGIQLTIQFPKTYFSSPQAVITQTDKLRFAPNYPQITTDKTGQYYVVKIISLNKNDGYPVEINSEMVMLQLTATPRQAGQTTINIIQDTIITQYQAGDQLNHATISQATPFNILADQSGIQSSSLTFPFKLQGLSKANVEVPVTVWILPINNNLDVLSDQKSIQKQVSFKSDAQGWLKPVSPIDITELVKTNPLPQEYRVLIKTPTSLRKTLGSFELVTSNQTVVIQHGGSSAWSSSPVAIGDFVQSGSGYNVINLFDINAMLQSWTDLTVTITENNRQFDVNFDNILNVIDVGLVINNWTELDGVFGD